MWFQNLDRQQENTELWSLSNHIWHRGIFLVTHSKLERSIKASARLPCRHRFILTTYLWAIPDGIHTSMSFLGCRAALDVRAYRIKALTPPRSISSINQTVTKPDNVSKRKCKERSMQSWFTGFRCSGFEDESNSCGLGKKGPKLEIMVSTAGVLAP